MIHTYTAGPSVRSLSSFWDSDLHRGIESINSRSISINFWQDGLWKSPVIYRHRSQGRSDRLILISATIPGWKAPRNCSLDSSRWEYRLIFILSRFWPRHFVNLPNQGKINNVELWLWGWYSIIQENMDMLVNSSGSRKDNVFNSSLSSHGYSNLCTLQSDLLQVTGCWSSRIAFS